LEGFDLNISFIFRIEQSTMDVEAGRARLSRLLKALAPALETDAWFMLPKSEEASKQAWVAFADKPSFLEVSRQDLAERLSEWPESPSGFRALLCSARDEPSYRANKGRGRCELSFAPGEGRIQLDVMRPDEAWPDRILADWVRDVLRAVVAEEWVEFANTDVARAPRLDGEKGEDVFSLDYRTFPHRQFLGWMGFVQRLPPKVPITLADLPQAAEVVPLPGRGGSLIVSVGETFDVHNPYHIRQAQQVEMRLVDLDALPVIDPDFMN